MQTLETKLENYQLGIICKKDLLREEEQITHREDFEELVQTYKDENRIKDVSLELQERENNVINFYSQKENYTSIIKKVEGKKNKQGYLKRLSKKAKKSEKKRIEEVITLIEQEKRDYAYQLLDGYQTGYGKRKEFLKEERLMYNDFRKLKRLTKIPIKQKKQKRSFGHIFKAAAAITLAMIPSFLNPSQNNVSRQDSIYSFNEQILKEKSQPYQIDDNLSMQTNNILDYVKEAEKVEKKRAVAKKPEPKIKPKKNMKKRNSYNHPPVNYKLCYNPKEEPVEAQDSQIYKGNVAFTFDCGSGDKGFDDILKTMDKYNVKGTFFLTGKFIEKYPNNIRKLLEKGHEAANHSYDHDHNNSPEECERVAKIFSDLTGEEMERYFRVPFLDHINWKPFKKAGWEKGYVSLITCDAMNINFEDKDFINAFKHYTNTGSKKMEFVYRLPREGPGNIDGASILMHVNGDKYHLLEDMIGYVIKKGYKPVKFSELEEERMIASVAKK